MSNDDCEKRPGQKQQFGKLDGFNMGVIRRVIHQFYIRNESPTLKNILLDLKDKMNFPYSRVTTLTSSEENGIFVQAQRKRTNSL